MVSLVVVVWRDRGSSVAISRCVMVVVPYQLVPGWWWWFDSLDPDVRCQCGLVWWWCGLCLRFGCGGGVLVRLVRFLVVGDVSIRWCGLVVGWSRSVALALVTSSVQYAMICCFDLSVSGSVSSLFGGVWWWILCTTGVWCAVGDVMVWWCVRCWRRWFSSRSWLLR